MNHINFHHALGHKKLIRCPHLNFFLWNTNILYCVPIFLLTPVQFFFKAEMLFFSFHIFRHWLFILCFTFISTTWQPVMSWFRLAEMFNIMYIIHVTLIILRLALASDYTKDWIKIYIYLCFIELVRSKVWGKNSVEQLINLLWPSM